MPPNMPKPPSFEELGSKQSLLGNRFVGLMRSLGGAVATAGAVGTAGVGLAYLEAHFPLVRRYDVPVAARPGLEETRILQISDLHMFPGQQFIVDFLATIAAEEDFDFVVSTGDNLGAVSGVASLLEAVEPLLEYPGAFVLGSNDYYSPERKPWVSYLDPQHREKASTKSADVEPDLPWFEVVNAMTESGWLDLTNQSATVNVPVGSGQNNATVALIGVDDPHIKRDRFPAVGEHWRDPGVLRLALSHSPYRRVLDQFTRDGADLILTGHTHGGQVRLPLFGAIVNNTDIPRRYSRGLYKWRFNSEESWLNISAGLGTSQQAPVRLFCRPEVSILRVCPVA